MIRNKLAALKYITHYTNQKEIYLSFEANYMQYKSTGITLLSSSKLDILLIKRNLLLSLSKLHFILITKENIALFKQITRYIYQ